jgi:hypothetical protein
MSAADAWAVIVIICSYIWGYLNGRSYERGLTTSSLPPKEEP